MCDKIWCIFVKMLHIFYLISLITEINDMIHYNK